jgi:rhamnogalacturonyl hydrolase YesR
MAVDQIIKYRSRLWNEDKRLFSHIWDCESASFENTAFWGVGNGWALAGMTRVVLLLPDSKAEERAMLLAYIQEALDGVLAYMRPDGVFHNVLDDKSSFVETNTAQQVAYTIFRLLNRRLISPEYLPRGLKAREAALSKVDATGLVRGVCGSPTFDARGTA